MLLGFALILLFGTIGLVAGGLSILWIFCTIAEKIKEKSLKKRLTNNKTYVIMQSQQKEKERYKNVY